MAQADPQSVKISGVTTSLPRVSTGDMKSRYESPDGLIDLSYSTQEGKRIRQVARIDHSKITSDPFITTQNVQVGTSVSLVIDRPIAGYTNAEVLAIVTGLIESLTAESSAKITKLIAKES
jgi:hypothetical protein